MKVPLWACALAPFLALPLFAQERTTEDLLDFSFRDASLETVLRCTSRVTGWFFVQEVPFRGTVTAYVRAKVPRSRCLDFLNAVLRPHGMICLATGGADPGASGTVLRIVESARGGGASPEIHVGADPRGIPLTDEVRTQIIPLTSAGVIETGKELGDLFRRTIGESGTLSISGTSNAFVVTGRSDAIHRIAEILLAVDRTASSQLKIEAIPLRFADAALTAKVLNDLVRSESARSEPAGLQGGPGILRFLRMEQDRGVAGSPSPSRDLVRITAETQANSILVCATEAHLTLLREILERIDRPDAALATYVFPLVNQDAVALAALLKSLWNNPSASAPAGRGGPTLPGRIDAAAAPGAAPAGGALPGSSLPGTSVGGARR